MVTAPDPPEPPPEPPELPPEPPLLELLELPQAASATTTIADTTHLRKMAIRLSPLLLIRPRPTHCNRLQSRRYCFAADGVNCNHDGNPALTRPPLRQAPARRLSLAP